MKEILVPSRPEQVLMLATDDVRTPEGNRVVTPAAEAPDRGVASRILLLDPAICRPAPGNRVPTMELAAPFLLPSIADIGQQVPGIVRPHPVRPGEYEVLAGNLRCFCSNILGKPFKAVLAVGDVSEAGVIKLRLTENEVREAMSPCEVADDLARYQQLADCTQAKLAEQLHLSETMISRTLRMSKNLAPDLRRFVDDFSVRPSSATLIASLPTHDLQRAAMTKAVERSMTRDAVAAMVAVLKGGRKEKQARPAKGRTPGGLVWSFAGTPEAMLAEADKLTKALQTLIKNGWGIGVLGNILKA
jgi:ParB/RepB/Spo0J family partition protein